MFKKLPKPKINLEDVFSKIKSKNKRKTSRIKKLLDKNTENSMYSYEENYSTYYFQKNVLKTTDTIGKLTAKDGKKIYEGIFHDYGCHNQILNQYIRSDDVSDILCPICDSNVSRHLDHVFPKSKYPQYVITPINLVPLCRNCNISKRDSTEELFNPYLEDLSELEGLHFEFNFSQSAPVHLIFDKNAVRLERLIEMHDIKDTIEAKANANWQALKQGKKYENVTSEDIRDILTNVNTNKKWEKIFYKELLSELALKENKNNEENKIDMTY